MTIGTLIEQQKLKKPPICMSDTSVFDAAVEIAEIDVNALAVVDDDALVGIITDHDIIRCLADSGPEFNAQSVKDWMTEKPLTCTADTKLAEALEFMSRRGVRHLPVLEGGQPVSVISSRELLVRIHEIEALEISTLRDLTQVSQAAQA